MKRLEFMNQTPIRLTIIYVDYERGQSVDCGSQRMLVS